MRRRSLLAAGSALLGVGACSFGAGTSTASSLSLDSPGDLSVIAPGMIGSLAAEADTGPLTAIIEYQGETYRFAETAGTDLGDYVDPRKRFVQGCVRVTNDQIPLAVYFRRDRGTDRAEVVFELGRLWSRTKPANLEAYRATILRADRTVFKIEVPQHYWFSRWRWQSSERPVTAKVNDLISSGLLPPYDQHAERDTIGTHAFTPYRIMELAGLARYMPTTGERVDIGPVTEVQGEFICTGRQAALAMLLAQAEAAGTFPWHYRDEHTGAPLSVIQYPDASVYSPQTGNPFIAGTKSGIVIDSAHQPAIAYVPFLLTGDPYHLETMQFQVTFNLIETPPKYRYHISQVRGHAWSTRTLGQAAKVTPDQTPQWLLPRSYFQEMLDRERDWLIHTFVESSDVERAVFRTTDQKFGDRTVATAEAGTFIAPWQDEFQAFILGWLVRMGFSDWDRIFRWKLGSTIARTNGTSGWIRAECTPFHLILREHSDSPWAQSWAECWRLNQARQNMQASDPDRLFVQGAAITYPTYTRAVLALAASMGIAEAKPCFEWLDKEIDYYVARRRGAAIDYKWSVT